MADDMTFSIGGLDGLNAQLQRIAKEAYDRAGAALRAEAELIMTDAKRRTPVLTGALRASGHVEGPDADGTVVLKFGGPAAGYAIPVHENLNAYHRVGEAKFLERPVLEAIPGLPARIAARMARE